MARCIDAVGEWVSDLLPVILVFGLVGLAVWLG